MDSFLGKCSVCFETPPFEKMTTVDKSSVCHDCIRQTFQRALDYEGNYPPSWGKHTLDVRKYTQQRILTLEFLGLYVQKEKEYCCLPANRIYCSWPSHGPVQQPQDKSKGTDNGKDDNGKAIDDRCNSFLGARIRSTHDVLVVSCKDCHNLTCRACEAHIYSSTDGMNHKCPPVSAADPDDAAFQGLKRGKDFQLCPAEDCETKVELSDGCNHVRCTCGMQFCFICGQPAMDGSGHWTKTDDLEPGCPRYGQPNSVRALYDDAPDHGIATTRFDGSVRPLHATEAIHPANLALREFEAAQRALALQRYYDARGSPTIQFAHDFRALNRLAEVEAARDENHNDRRRGRLTILSLDTAAPSPAQLTGPQRHGHPYHIEPIGEFAVEDEETNDAPDQRTQLQQHQRRLQLIRRELERHARRWPGNHAGASRDVSSPAQAPQSVPNLHGHLNSAPENVNTGIPRVHFQDPLQVRADTRQQDQPARLPPPLFPSAADVRPGRSWHSMLPVPTFTNAPVASLRSRSGLVPGPRARSAPVYAPLPPSVLVSTGDRNDSGRGRELADDTDAESGKEDGSRRDSRAEEE